MSWEPISLSELKSLVNRELAECSEELQVVFAQTRITPVKWRQSPWGDLGSGFWAVAVKDDRVLWYNDIEEGFNVSSFVTQGEIPQNQYWCNQDCLRWALPGLESLPHDALGPPMALPPYE